MHFVYHLILIASIFICGSVVGQKTQPGRSIQPTSKNANNVIDKEAKKKKLLEIVRKNHQTRAANTVNQSQTMSVRMRRYEEAVARKKSLLLQQRQERIKEAQQDFNSRLHTDSPAWVEKYPLSVFCKNFTDYPKEYFKSRTLKNEAKTVIHFPCIPAMILPIALDPYGFTYRLFASIDFCISNLYIYKSDEVNIEESLVALDKSLVRNIVVRSHPFPIRLTQAWNSGIREIDKVSWYLFCANDVQFAPFQLAALNRKFWLKSGLLHPLPETHVPIDFAFFNWKNMDAAGYNLFIMKKSVFDLIGNFDENMHPAFFEDADMDRRIDMCNRIPDNSCKVVQYLIQDVCPWHGKRSHIEYESGTRAYEEERPEWPRFISNAFAMNEQYYRNKWGCPADLAITPENCTFVYPFNGEHNHGVAKPGPLRPLSQLRVEDLRVWTVNETRVRYINSFLWKTKRDAV